MDKFLGRLADDLETYAVHAKRKTIEVEDAELLLRRWVFYTMEYTSMIIVSATRVWIMGQWFLPGCSFIEYYGFIFLIFGTDCHIARNLNQTWLTLCIYFLTFTFTDVFFSLCRQGYVNDKVPVEVLIEKYLRMEQRKLLIPIATNGNVVIPKTRKWIFNSLFHLLDCDTS